MHAPSHTPDKLIHSRIQCSVCSSVASAQAQSTTTKSKLDQLQLIESKTNVAQAPHLPPHTKPARFSAHNLSSEPDQHTDSIAHSQLLTSAERSHDPYIDTLECRCVRHACTPRTKRKKDRWRWWLKHARTCGRGHGHGRYRRYRCTR